MDEDVVELGGSRRFRLPDWRPSRGPASWCADIPSRLADCAAPSRRACRRYPRNEVAKAAAASAAVLGPQAALRLVVCLPPEVLGVL